MTGIAEYEVGNQYDGFLMVKDVMKSETRNGKPYLRTTLGDSTGQVVSMIWDAGESKEEVFTKGNIVHIKGTVSDYQGTKQIDIRGYRIATEDDNVEISDFLEAAPIVGKTLIKSIAEDVKAIKNKNIKKITMAILNKYRNEFVVHPAAKGMHHNYVSGLAFHTYSMVNLAKAICELYTDLNKDLLVAGAILHDIGKIKELSGNVGTEYTLEGMLKGHISIISEEIKYEADEHGITGEEVLLLQHMVLSHHGKGEWGSPVSPQLIEAHVLHQIDMMDAGIDMYRKASKGVKQGELTERIFGLDNKSFYSHGLNN